MKRINPLVTVDFTIRYAISTQFYKKTDTKFTTDIEKLRRDHQRMMWDFQRLWRIVNERQQHANAIMVGTVLGEYKYE